MWPSTDNETAKDFVILTLESAMIKVRATCPQRSPGGDSVRVWIDQDLCTGDGLCTDHCPDVFMLLEDGLSYVRDHIGSPCNDPGGRTSIVSVSVRHVDHVITAALDCPGECIFLEDDEPDSVDDLDIVDAELVDSATGS